MISISWRETRQEAAKNSMIHRDKGGLIRLWKCQRFIMEIILKIKTNKPDGREGDLGRWANCFAKKQKVCSALHYNRCQASLETKVKTIMATTPSPLFFNILPHRLSSSNLAIVHLFSTSAADFSLLTLSLWKRLPN